MQLTCSKQLVSTTWADPQLSRSFGYAYRFYIKTMRLQEVFRNQNSSVPDLRDAKDPEVEIPGLSALALIAWVIKPSEGSPEGGYVSVQSLLARCTCLKMDCRMETQCDSWRACGP